MVQLTEWEKMIEDIIFGNAVRMEIPMYRYATKRDLSSKVDEIMEACRRSSTKVKHKETVYVDKGALLILEIRR